MKFWRFTFNKSHGSYYEELGWCPGYWEADMWPWLQVVRLVDSVHIHFLGGTLYIYWMPTKWLRWDRGAFPNFGSEW